jgi:DtxR family Mn-dependent transcriptional regulator
MEDYLKTIYAIDQEGQPVTTQRLADEMQISAASVTNMVKRLNALKMLVHLPYRGVSLTPEGTAVALEVIRHHRLLELYLTRALGFDIDQVHDEADRLEHHVSEELENRMAAILGDPEFDPHGHPIPSRSGDLPERADIPLLDLEPGQGAVVSRVSDRQPERLREIDAHGLRPGIHLQRSGRSHTDLRVTIEGRDIAIPADLATLIHVLPDAPDAIS